MGNATSKEGNHVETAASEEASACAATRRVHCAAGWGSREPSYLFSVNHDREYVPGPQTHLHMCKPVACELHRLYQCLIGADSDVSDAQLINAREYNKGKFNVFQFLSAS